MDVLQLIYEDQIERLREKEVKEAKKRQRLGDNFLDLLYSIKVSYWPHSRVLDCIFALFHEALFINIRRK